MNDADSNEPVLDPEGMPAPASDKDGAAKPPVKRRPRKVAQADAPLEAAAQDLAPGDAPADEEKPAPRPRRRKVAPVEEGVQPETAPLAAVESVQPPIEALDRSPEMPVFSLGDANSTAPIDLAGDAGRPLAGEATPFVAAPERSERRRRDRPPRGDRPAPAGPGAETGDAAGAEAATDAAVADALPPLERVDVSTRFADVLSGQFDTEVPEDEAAAEALGKRVLRPEPEAPKLHKVLAQAGIGSRRDMEELIQEGRVTVNGEVAHQGMRITHGDQIKVAGKPVKVRIAPPPARVLAYHKPVGEVVTHHDPEGRPTVFRRLPRLPQGKWLSVGRLDINTEGLLLFTTSGELSNQLMHPRFGVEREYAVRVLGMLGEDAREELLEGVEIEGQKAAFKSIEDGGGEGANHWYRVVIAEGRNREVRKLFDEVGLTVSRLIRIRYGVVVLPRGLKRGTWVELSDDDVRAMRRSVAFEPRNGPPQGQGPGQNHGQNQGQNPGPGQGKKNRNKRRGRNGNGPFPDQGPPQGQGPYQGGNHQGGARQGGAPRQEPRDFREGGAPARPVDRDRDEDDDIPLRIPNPLEQTFDRRFATGSKRISAGFGRPSDQEERDRQNPKGPKQPDPMQTSVGYIGADAYFRKAGGGGKGRNRRGGSGGR